MFLYPLFAFFDLVALETRRWQICLALVLGLWLGLTPWVTLHWFALVFAAFLFRFNPLAVACSFLLFHAVSWGLEPVFHDLGLRMLMASGLKRLWSGLYHAPILTFLRLNNSVVMGSLVVATLLSPIVYLVSAWIYTRHGARLYAWFQGSTFWLSWTRTELHRAYARRNR